MLRDAKARGDRRLTRTEAKLFRFKLLTYALDGQQSAFLICVRENNQELFSANARANVTKPGIRLNNSREFLEDGITGLVTVGVVDGLEVIYVGHNNPEVKAMPVCAADLPYGPIFDCAAIGQAGQRVGKRQFLQQAILGLNLSVEFDDSAAHANASEKLLGMKWLCKVIVRASREPRDKFVFFGDAGKDDDVCIGLGSLMADVFAEFYSAQVRHHPVSDYQGRLVLGKESDGLLAALSKYNGVLLLGKSLLDKLAVNGRIVDYQNFEIAGRGVHLEMSVSIAQYIAKLS
ncbi:MAG TPA: hypothetical protein VGT03_14530 [Candidatus Acidoferrales bacterium]|nr:hypothetical protein [Candidatus Acidoferrales bacterium]